MSNSSAGTIATLRCGGLTHSAPHQLLTRSLSPAETRTQGSELPQQDLGKQMQSLLFKEKVVTYIHRTVKADRLKPAGLPWEQHLVCVQRRKRKTPSLIVRSTLN